MLRVPRVLLGEVDQAEVVQDPPDPQVLRVLLVPQVPSRDRIRRSSTTGQGSPEPREY